MIVQAPGSQEVAVLRRLLRPSYFCPATIEMAHEALNRLNRSTYPCFHGKPHGIGMVGTSAMGERLSWPGTVYLIKCALFILFIYNRISSFHSIH